MKQVALLVALVALAALPACVPSQPTPDPVTRPATRPTAVPAAPPATAPATAPVTFFGDEPVDVTTVSGPVTALDDRWITVWPHYPAGATERPPPSAYRIEAHTRVTVPRPHPDGTSTRGVPGTRADLRVGQLVILTAEDGVARLIHIVRDPAGQPAAAPTSGPSR